MKLNMNKKKGIVSFVAMLLCVILAGLLVVVGLPSFKIGDVEFGGRGKAANITQGLDLKGGVSITYQVMESNSDWDATDLEDTRSKMEKRIQQYSTEATAYVEGTNRIVVSIPGEYDADKVLDELGKPGSLYFCTAATPTEEEVESGSYVEVDGSYFQIWVTGDQIADAQGVAGTADSGEVEYLVSLSLTETGSEAFYNMTSAYVGQQTYIIYDNEIISAPTVQTAISGGQAQIDGMASIEEAEELASNLRIGALTLELEDISSQVTNGQLGSDALSKSLMAGLIGLILIIIFMLVVYRVPGLAAGLSLIVYIELILLTLNAFDMTLTLPSIAGIILNIGMAVDANVIIYARIREEIAAGNSVKAAIKTGFDKATSAIVDGNITTFIAAIVLLLAGSGTVKGFAETLAIGIIVQLFTALVISKILVWTLYHMGFKKPGFYGKEAAKKTFKFVQRKAVCFAISIVVIVAGLGVIGYNTGAGNDPFELSIEFKGGTSTKVEFEQEYTQSQLEKEVKPAFDTMLGTSDVSIEQDRDNKKVCTIKTKNMNDDEQAKFEEMLASTYPGTVTESTEISSTISGEMRQQAVVATLIATLMMLVYIWVRFKNMSFAIAAVVALLHDVLIVIGFYGVSRVTVGTTFIACLLTIIGYSINATIVIFDRIRENRALMDRGDKMIDVVNKSISQTLTRSIYTTLTTFVMVFMIYIMGVTSIKEFTLPLMVGLIAGAYSSVFIAGSLWYVLRGRKYDK